MASIAQLFVELGINTAAFKEGLDKATFAAKQFAKEMKADLQEAGQSVKELGGAFASMATGNIEGAMDRAQQAIKPLLDQLGEAGGVAGGAAGAFLAVGTAALGAAAHFALTADRLNELSQTTGIAVETLSGLRAIAAADGIGMETLAKAFEKLSKSAVQAAQAGPTAKNAFTDLGISITDVNGKMLDSQQIFDNVAAKFARMPDGPLKTAEAMQIFGRAGAGLIPLLNEGGAKIEEFRQHAEKLNAVVSKETAAASAEFNENLELMRDAFSGISNELASDLVPALNVAAKSFIEFFENNQSEIKSFVDGIAEIAKVTLNVFQEVALLFSLIYRAFVTAVDELQVFGRTVGTLYDDIKSRRFGSLWDDLKNGGKEAASELSYNMDQALESIKKTAASMVGVTTAVLPKVNRGNGADAPVAGKHIDLTFMEKEVAMLERQAQKEQELAAAIGKVTVSNIEAKAAAEAHAASEKLIDEAMQKGLSRGAAEAAVAKYIARIQEATRWTAAFQAVVESQGAFDKFDTKINEQITSLEGQARAMNAAQREFAKNDATLTPLRNNLAALTAEWDELAVSPGTDIKRLNALGDAIKRQSAELEDETAKVQKLDAAWQGVQFSKQLEEINQKTDALNIENAALLAGNPYGVLEANLAKFIKTMELAPEQAEKLRAALHEQEKATAQQGAMKVAQGLGFDSSKLTQLRQERDALASLDLPAKEYERTLTKINADIADQEAKTGGMSAQVKSAFADFSASVEEANTHVVKDLIGQGIKGVSDSFAQMVANGKADWQGLIQSMEAALMKSAISNILNSLFKSIGSALSSQGGFLGGLGSLFSGGHALGGSVVPGNDYIVGENGPEVMRVDNPATVYSNGHGPAGGGTSIVQNWNITTPNADSFGRSSKQISAQMYREASYAHAHTKG
jgi:hypothetical protein